MRPATRPQASLETSFRGAVLDGASNRVPRLEPPLGLTPTSRTSEREVWFSSAPLLFGGRRGQPLARAHDLVGQGPATNFVERAVNSIKTAVNSTRLMRRSERATP